jgi:hypothetical protein
MRFTLRIDLDYVPWDTPDAHDFGHGEPAMVLRLLDLARAHGLKYHFFASNRVLRAFPCIPDAVLNDGHVLDWLCKHPDEFDQRYAEMLILSGQIGQQMEGFAVRGEWPEELADHQAPPSLRWLSAAGNRCPPGLVLHPVVVSSDRESSRLGLSFRAWADAAKNHLRSTAAKKDSATLCVRPQALAVLDPRLSVLREVCQFAWSLGLEMRTLREAAQANER